MKQKKYDEVEIVISEHAKERIRERIQCRDEKIMKIAKKAWVSNEPIKMEEVASAKVHIQRFAETSYRKFMGYVYAFVVLSSKKVLLVTVIPPTTSMIKRRSLKKLSRGGNTIKKPINNIWSTES